MRFNSKRILIIVGVALIAALVIILMTSNSGNKDLTYTEFVTEMEAGNVSDVYVQDFKCYVRYNGSKISSSEFPRKYDKVVYIDGRVSISELIYNWNESNDSTATGKKDVNLEFNNPNSGSIWSILYIVGGLAMLGLLAVFVIRSLNNSNRQAMNFGRSKARLNQNIKVRFNDVAGAEEEKEELVEIIEFLKNPRKFSSVGARIPKGVLLVGPPGTGKTLFAKAVAGEANVPFFSISGSDFVEMFVGVGASRVRDLFEDAKKYMPCIVFIDEIDAVGRQRGTGMGGGHDEREQTLNQLLVQMDGFETNSGIIIMAATNRADVLDPALLRPGRFDRQIYVHLPDVRGREAIFKIHARNKPISPDVDFNAIARLTSGLSGADIENILNEAAILAARANRTVITTVDISEGINKVEMGPQKKSRVVTEVDKRITAYHEAGHAILSRSLKNGEPVHEVSIIQRGAAAGYTLIRSDREDDSHLSYGFLIDRIAMTMGGRAAEELFIKDICSGASGDIKSATQLARRMITDWGMSDKVGVVYLGTSQELFLGRDFQSTTHYSEKMAAVIDDEVKRIVEEGHETAKKTLSEKKDVVDKMVRLLIEKETIYSEEVEACMQGKPLAEIIAEMDNRLEIKKQKLAQEAEKAPVISPEI